MASFVLVYMTASSEVEASKIAEVLVQEKLAACVNIMPGVKSIYRWNNTIEKANEVVFFAKTKSELFVALSERVKALHSHSCPCVVALPLVNSTQPFLDWLEAATS